MKGKEFEKQLKLGQLGEKKVFNYLNNLPDTIDVIRMDKNTIFQSYGVDGFLIEDRENDLPFGKTFFDVKTDFEYHKTGKLFIEIMADTNMNKKGGILSSKADVFYYYDPFGGELFTLPLYATRLWYNRIGISMNHKEVVNEHGQKTTGVVVNPEALENAGIQLNQTNIGILQHA